jgi:C4-dicarboxylate-specific signal transduction histidine kinase
MSKAHPAPLQRQLLVALALLLLPLIAVAVWLGFEEVRETTEELVQQAQETARVTAAAIDRELIGFDRMAQNLSSHPAVQQMRPEALALLRAQHEQRPTVIDLVLVDRDGNLVARSQHASAISRLWGEILGPAAYHGGRVVLPLTVGPSGVHYVPIVYPVKDGDGALVGALGYYVVPQLPRDGIPQLSLPEGSVVAVTDRMRRVLAHNLDGDRLVGLVLGDERFTDGVERVFGQAPALDGLWAINVGIPTSVAGEQAVSLGLRAVPVFLLGLSIWLVVARVYTQRLAGSVAHLDAAAQRIASGDFSPMQRRPMPTLEFAQFQNAFDSMLRRFNESRAALDAQMAEERRMREAVESLQRQVIRQERLTAVGQLVSGVAHEINNPLQAILGFAELLQMQHELPESVRNDLQLIQKESARACGIIRNLAMFARQQTGQAEPVRLTDVIRSVTDLRQRRLESENIELRIEDTSERPVMAVMTELQQVVLNFVVNAEQAIILSGRQPGRVTIRSRDEGPRTVLEVEDTGPGIAAEHEARLFQPFFTTKPVGQGTGLGLSVSYGIIDSLGGTIGYRRAPAGGAIFYFELPPVSS